jgi:hypothetical protein
MASMLAYLYDSKTNTKTNDAATNYSRNSKVVAVIQNTEAI